MKIRKSVLIVSGVIVLLAFTIDFQEIFWAFHRRSRPPLPDFAEKRLGKVHFFYLPQTPVSSRIQEMSTKIHENIRRAESEMGHHLSAWKVYLYNDWEEKGAAADDIRVASVEPGNQSLHFIVNKDMDGSRERSEYQLLLEPRYGKPFDEEWTEFFGAAKAGVWNQRTLQQWAEFLLARNLRPAFPDYFSNRSISPYIRTPWNAIFLQFMEQQFGKESVIAFYQKGAPPHDYEPKWQKYLQKFKASGLERTNSFSMEFQKGISYAYANGYDSGYATRKSRKSLDLLKAMGITWIASIPYGYMRSSQSIAIGRPGHHIAGEADETVFALAKDARARKMKVMLKPQIWISHRSWPGRIDFPRADLWRQWMKSYEHWIIHYAILAELTDADLFCIGTEFVQATTKNPQLWKELILSIRQVYGGPLTYAANYGKEFEEISFWSDLDYIGLDNYYQVRKSESEGIQQIKEGFLRQKEKIKAVSDRYKKPVLFTEIGYLANSKAGMGHQEYDKASYDETMQRVCYQFALETYWNEPWFAGMYWWKWFSDPDDRGRNADSHSPHGRPAEKVLAEWYRKDRR